MSVAARYPHIPTKFLACGESPYANAKVWSLEHMQRAAEHKILVISDSDVSVTPDYLRAVVAPFADHRIGLVTCLYRGVALPPTQVRTAASGPASKRWVCRWRCPLACC